MNRIINIYKKNCSFDIFLNLLKSDAKKLCSTSLVLGLKFF